MSEARPFDEAEDASPCVAAARERAQDSGRALMLVFGANWCPDARAFAGFLEEPAITEGPGRRLEIVLVDVGRHDRHQQLVAAFGLDVPLEGVPAVLVLDAGGRPLDADNLYRWRTARSADPGAVAAWLETILPPTSGDAS
ncbi:MULTISPECIES: thioredoxin family protein [Marinicauda]|jgi:thioredoxin 1|uniref:thioredoxin family protein n=1 Tax=Marinicauda TaxID=1649466 RepID=UPI0022E14321|nr:thioredoxin family protein [Marinicauda sp. Alg238-R41]